MNQALQARSQRVGGNRALAISFDRNAEHFDSIEITKELQAQRLTQTLSCPQDTAYTLASLAFGVSR